MLVITIFLYYYFRIGKKAETADKHIVQLLKQSDEYLGNSPDTAFIKANQALILAQKTTNNSYIVKSTEIIGQVKNILGDTKQAFTLYSRALNIAKKEQLEYDISKLSIDIGELYYNWGIYDTSLIYFNRALNLAEKQQEKHLIALSLTYVGKYYRVKGQFNRAMGYFQRALEIARNSYDNKQIAFTLNTQGKYYIGEGNLAAALQCYQDAYKASERVKDKLLLADVCNHLGGLYLLTNEYEKSLEFHRKALSFRNIMNNPEGMAKSYNNIGKAFLELQNTDSAMIYFQKSLENSKQTNYKKGIIKAMTNIGKIYAIQKKEELSEQILLEAYGKSTQSGYDLGIAETSLALGNLYKDKATDKAISYFEKSTTILEKLDFDELMRINFLGLYECYNKKNDFKRALHFHTLLLVTEKKILNIENNRQLAILQLTYNTERKEKDNKVLRADNELKAMTIKRNFIFMWFNIALLVATILLCLFIYNRFYSKSIANRRLEALNVKITNQNHTLETLNYELNAANEEKDKLFSIIAHELRNPLYWFQNLVEVLSKNFETMKPEKVKKSLLSLDESAKNAFHLMDNLLQWSRSRLNRITLKKSSLSLATEVKESTKMFETIIQYKEITLNITIPETIIINADADLLSCVIRNLVSNAIKYTPAEGIISIESSEDNDFVTVIVSDTGLGINTETISEIFDAHHFNSNLGLMQEKGSGLGLKLCKEFVEMNGGTIWVTNNDEHGTRFMFTLSKII